MPRPQTFRRHPSSPEGGYILLTLIFFVAVLVILAAAAVPRVVHEIKRDREEELVHRGAQYARAIRRFYRKNSRFPNSIEELETSNNLRYLRRRYKDPITGQDFKLLHFGEVKFSFGAGLGQGFQNPGALGQQLGQQPGGLQPATNATNDPTQNQPDETDNPPPNPNGPGGATPSPNPSANGPGGQTGPSSAPLGPNSGPNAGPLGSGPTFGGGLGIVGVVSTSRKTSIREFDRKNHYNQWQFIYDPGNDRGGLLNAPSQPPLQGVGGGVNNPTGGPAGPNQPGQPTAPGPQNPPPQGGPDNQQ
jgi:type II secretory pathway pseudopilin PulG